MNLTLKHIFSSLCVCFSLFDPFKIIIVHFKHVLSSNEYKCWEEKYTIYFQNLNIIHFLPHTIMPSYHYGTYSYSFSHSSTQFQTSNENYITKIRNIIKSINFMSFCSLFLFQNVCNTIICYSILLNFIKTFILKCYHNCLFVCLLFHPS